MKLKGSLLGTNPVLVLVIGLPLVAVVASVATAIVTIAHPDGELPEQYHWEGFQLDRDFSRSHHATELAIRATLRNLGHAGTCEVELEMAGAAPEQLALTIAHATRPALDRRLQFQRMSTRSDAGETRATYAAPCVDMPQGHWRLELSDREQSWSIRQGLRGSLDLVRLDATTAEEG